MRVLVTGANGFIGRELVQNLVQDGYSVVAPVRRFTPYIPKAVKQVVISDLSEIVDWTEVLSGVTTVIHLAARAHVISESEENPSETFYRVNTQVTIDIARQAASVGVQKFIYMSSIGVNGNSNSKPFTENQLPNPQEDYAVSKWRAEQGLTILSEETDMEIVIIRPPLVYGSNAPGNFCRLLKWVSSGMPLPLGAIYNQRSFVALDNIVSFIIHCVDHPKSANEIFKRDQICNLT